MKKEEFEQHVKTVVAQTIRESMGGDDGKTVAQLVEEKMRKAFESQESYPQFIRDALAAKAKGDAASPKERKKGEAMARVTRAYINARSENTGYKGAVEQLQKWGDEDLADAIVKGPMTVVNATQGGFLVPEQFSTDVIELLRPQSVVRDLVGMSLPMPGGTISIPKITQGSSAYYQGEASAATASALGTGVVKFTWKKLTSLVPMSNDLLRYSSPAADTIVRNDMVRAIAQRENQAFLRDVGTDSAPKGLRYLAANAGSPIFANSSISLANTTTDLGKMILDLLNDNVPILSGGWIMAPRTYMYLYTVLTTNGVFAFRDEMSRGTLWGYPYRVTTQVPINLTDHGGTDESELYFADFADVVIADSMALRVDASTEASYTDGATTVSAFQNDLTLVRAITEHDFNTRRAESISIMNGVRWGA